MKRLAFVLILIASMATNGLAAELSDIEMVIPPFSTEMAYSFSESAMKNITQMNSVSDEHKAFVGCTQWYLSVQNHWLLVRLLKQYPELSNREAILALLNKNLSPENLREEMIFLKKGKDIPLSYVYGWSWILKLSAELSGFNDPTAKKCFDALIPLAELVKGYYYELLPDLYYPIRKGGRTNTAFALSFALDYAKAREDVTFEKFIQERALFYFSNDRQIPASWEPDGDDFLSPSLSEAYLMAKVMDQSDFARWLKDFMPELPFSLMHPVVVTNRMSKDEMNLDALNVTRAWHLFSLALLVPDDSQIHRDLWQSGYRHATESLPNVLFDEQIGNDWISTFVLCMYLSLP